jgi:hypothetical protein
MKKIVTVTKVTRLLKLADILADILSDMSDEGLLAKYDLSWRQLGKVYSKLYYGAILSKEDMLHRMELRDGRDASHIPFVEIEDMERLYECEVCGFASPFHFTSCPKCRQLNLRRLKWASVAPSFRPGHVGHGV